jgi:hypothetical protein
LPIRPSVSAAGMPSSRLTSALDSVAESSLRRESAAVLVAAGIAFLQTTRSGGAASYRATNTGQDKLTSVFNAPEPKAGRRQPRSRPATHGQQQHVLRQLRALAVNRSCVQRHPTERHQTQMQKQGGAGVVGVYACIACAATGHARLWNGYLGIIQLQGIRSCC